MWGTRKPSSGITLQRVWGSVGTLVIEALDKMNLQPTGPMQRAEGCRPAPLTLTAWGTLALVDRWVAPANGSLALSQIRAAPAKHSTASPVGSRPISGSTWLLINLWPAGFAPAPPSSQPCKLMVIYYCYYQVSCPLNCLYFLIHHQNQNHHLPEEKP